MWTGSYKSEEDPKSGEDPKMERILQVERIPFQGVEVFRIDVARSARARPYRISAGLIFAPVVSIV
jgi:hypothetical protein